MTDHQDPTDRVFDLIEESFEPSDWPTDHAELDELAEAWRIDGERTAVWAHTKLVRALARRSEAETTAADLYAIADAHRERVERETAHDVSFFTAKLHAYTRDQTAGTRRRSVKIPTATLKITAGGVTTDLDDSVDADDIVAWAEDNDPDLVVYHDPTIDKAALKKKYGAKIDTDPGSYPAVDTETGERVPGVTFTRKPETFTVVPIDTVDADTAAVIVPPPDADPLAEARDAWAAEHGVDLSESE